MAMAESRHPGIVGREEGAPCCSIDLNNETIVKHRIRRVAPLQVAKVMGIMYAIAGLLFAPFFALAWRAAPEAQGFGTGFVFALPFLYGILGFVFTAIAAAVYNMVAGWVGGIEVELEAGAG